MPTSTEIDCKWEALRETLAVATQADFYRCLYEQHGVAQIPSCPTDLSEYFGRLPFLEPADIISSASQLRSHSMPVFRVSCSGGTLGRPKILFRTRSDWDRSVHNVAELFATAGVQAGTNMLILQPFGMWAIGHLALDACGLLKVMVLPAGNHEDLAFLSYLFSQFPITTVFATPSLWKRFTSYTAKANVPRQVRMLLAGERLVEEDRRYLSDYWRGGVYNIYGSEETDGLAAECEFHRGMHILEHSFVLELLSEGKTIDWSRPGDYEGELVITSLYHQGTPLVRYRLGDLVRVHRGPQRCECGNFNPTLEILGKSEEVVQLFDAARLSLCQLDVALRSALHREVYFQLLVEDGQQAPFLETLTILIGDNDIGEKERDQILREVATCSREVADSVHSQQLELRVARSDWNAAWTHKGKRRRIIDRRSVRLESL